MLPISKNTASAGAMHASITINGVSEEFLDTFNEPDNVLNSVLCTPELQLAHVDFQYRAQFLVVPCFTKVGCVLLHKMSLPLRVGRQVPLLDRGFPG